MPFDPNLPQENTDLDAVQVRAQLNALKALIDALQAQVNNLSDPLPVGSISPSAALQATAASTALPPALRMSMPIWVTSGTLVQTIPCCAITSERVANARPVTRSG